jgi:hypothetical protein
LENFKNLWILTLVTSLSTLLPILLIPMVPEGVKDCEESADAVDESTGEANSEEEASIAGEMRRKRRASSGNVTKVIARSKRGGGAFLTVLIVGLLYSIVNAGVKLFSTDSGEITENLHGNITSIDGMNKTNSTFKWECELEAVKEKEDTAGTGSKDDE